MAVSFRVSTGLTAMPELELPLPSSLSCIASEKFAAEFPSTNSRSPLKLHYRSANNHSKFSAVSSTGIRAIATGVQEALPPPLTSTSAPPSVFDGTTRLYISYTCPYAQRVWITRNCKGLQNKIRLVPIDLKDRPAWYKEKVYPANKVPALEHNYQVRGESLDLIKYVDSEFEGPSLYPDNPDMREFAEELLSYTDTFYKTVTSSFKGDVTEAGAAFDYIENALSKYDGGPFFLGQFSLVDIAYAPFIERFQAFLLDVKNYDIAVGRPKLAAWNKEMNNIDAYKQTCRDRKELVESYKKRFLPAD